MQSWIEGIDYYYNAQGYMVLTEKFLRERGSCCGNGCRHCPYDHINVPEPQRSRLLAQRKKDGDTPQAPQ